MKNFKDKIVVVTGAGSGMGRAFAVEFAKNGAHLALNDFDKTALKETVDIIKSSSKSKVYVEDFDVSDFESMSHFSKNVKKELGAAHIVINNAGVEGSVESFYHTSIAEIKRVMDVNFYGVVNGCKAFLPQLVENNEGAIVNVSSIFGLAGIPNHSDYCASKFAVRGFTESLAVEFINSPINIHCLHPGGIDTNISRNEKGKIFSNHYLSTPPESIAKYLLKSIQTNKVKLVFGKGSLKTWLGSNIVPQELFNTLIWQEMKKVIDISRYSDFIKK